MKKISKAELKRRFNNGWEVDTVVTPKPKPKPKPKLKEVVAESIKHTSGETFKAIDQLAKVMTGVYNQQMKDNKELKTQMSKIADRKITVEMPAQKDISRKKQWKFTVQRDVRGFIENIIAEEI